MTDKVFWQDPYLDHLRTEVSAIDGDIVRLRATIFYANAGGQESDSGTIAGIAVLKAERTAWTSPTLPPAGLHAGDEVDVRIDWARRYGLMRHHFAAEMVLQLIYDCEPGILKVGAHISPAKARIDFQRATSISELFPTIQPQADALIAADKPIVTAFSDGRIIGGTGRSRIRPHGLWRHASAQDREIDGIALKRKNQGKGVERVEIVLPATDENRHLPAVRCGNRRP